MEEERIVRPRILDQPMHSPENVLLRRLTHRVLLIIRKDDHIFPFVAEVLN